MTFWTGNFPGCNLSNKWRFNTYRSTCSVKVSLVEVFGPHINLGVFLVVSGILVTFYQQEWGNIKNRSMVQMIESVQILMGLCHVFPTKNGGIVFWNHPIWHDHGPWTMTQWLCLSLFDPKHRLLHIKTTWHEWRRYSEKGICWQFWLVQLWKKRFEHFRLNGFFLGGPIISEAPAKTKRRVETWVSLSDFGDESNLFSWLKSWKPSQFSPGCQRNMTMATSPPFSNREYIFYIWEGGEFYRIFHPNKTWWLRLCPCLGGNFNRCFLPEKRWHSYTPSI